MRKLDQLVIVDLEATCWEDKPNAPESEIIEIGACLLDLSTNTLSQKTSILVVPNQSELSQFCINLTGISPEMLKAAGVPLHQAIARLEKEFQISQRPWASYGDYDRGQFTRECRSKRIRYPFSPRHYNIKGLLALRARWDKEVGLDVAMQRLGIPMEGRHHRGHDDAWNIAKIAQLVFSPL